jgi:hypothetical protein
LETAVSPDSGFGYISPAYTAQFENGDRALPLAARVEADLGIQWFSV